MTLITITKGNLLSNVFIALRLIVYELTEHLYLV